MFQDLAMGMAGPLGGLLAKVAGLDSVYLAAAVGSMAAAAVAMVLTRQADAAAQ
jgi:hypothetical protein